MEKRGQFEDLNIDLENKIVQKWKTMNLSFEFTYFKFLKNYLCRFYEEICDKMTLRLKKIDAPGAPKLCAQSSIYI